MLPGSCRSPNFKKIQMSFNNNAVCRREDLNFEPHGTNLYRNKTLEHHKYFAAHLLRIPIVHEMTQRNLTQSYVTVCV